MKITLSKSQWRAIGKKAGWIQASKPDYFITDLGEPKTAHDPKTNEVIMTIPRYGVWGNKGRGKPEVIETSDDLEALMKKYNVSKENVFPLPSFKSKPDNIKEAQNQSSPEREDPKKIREDWIRFIQDPKSRSMPMEDLRKIMEDFMIRIHKAKGEEVNKADMKFFVNDEEQP